jgi:hypothetical protein
MSKLACTRDVALSLTVISATSFPGEESAVGAAAHNSDSWLTSRVHLVTSNENDRKTLIYALREVTPIRSLIFAPHLPVAAI